MAFTAIDDTKLSQLHQKTNGKVALENLFFHFFSLLICVSSIIKRIQHCCNLYLLNIFVYVILFFLLFSHTHTQTLTELLLRFWSLSPSSFLFTHPVSLQAQICFCFIYSQTWFSLLGFVFIKFSSDYLFSVFAVCVCDRRSLSTVRSRSIISVNELEKNLIK